MRQSKYLNSILTVNAVLLAGLLWTQIASSAVLDREAVAQVPAYSIPNASAQRQRMIESMRDVERSVTAMQKMLESGRLKVKVSNLDEIRFDAPSPQAGDWAPNPKSLRRGQ